MILRRLAWAATAVYWATLFALTHLPPQQLPQPGMNDKVEHFLAYALLAGMLAVTMWIRGVSVWRVAAIVIVVGMLYGVVDEQTQKLVGRDCELGDWIADSIGVVAATLMVTLARLGFTARRAGLR